MVRHLILPILLCFVASGGADARDEAMVRDGTTEQKAIVVPTPRDKAHEWELAYLNEHFADRGIDFVGDRRRGKDGKDYDFYSFKIGGHKREVHFVLP